MLRICLLSLAVGFSLGSSLGCRRPPAPTDNGEREPAAPELPLTQPPPTCDGQPCEPPRQCISYFGIAGAAGPTFHACEIPCDVSSRPEDRAEFGSGSCPEGMRCVTIADGPGSVCR
jgi:hypothetical protein